MENRNKKGNPFNIVRLSRNGSVSFAASLYTIYERQWSLLTRPVTVSLFADNDWKYTQRDRLSLGRSIVSATIRGLVPRMNRCIMCYNVAHYNNHIFKR